MDISIDDQQNANFILRCDKGGELENKLTSLNLQCNITLSLEGNINDDDVTYLGKFIRKNTQLEKIDLSKCSGLLGIDHNAFELCTHLKSIKLPICIKHIGNHSFDSCKRLKKILLPDGLETVGDKAFANCDDLKEINIPNSVSYIGIGSFHSCHKLTEMNVEDGNTRYSYNNDILYDRVDRTLIKYIPNHPIPDTYATPSEVIHIGNYAFDGCKGLEKIKVNDGCTDLGERTFVSCVDLKKVILPKTIDNIIPNAFENCNKLEYFEVDENSEHYSSVDGVLYSKNKDILVLCPKSKKSPFIFPSSVTEIKQGAFAGCLNMHTIYLPSSIKKINEKAFCGCEELRYIDIPSNINVIGDFAFSECCSLKQISIYASKPPHCGISPFDKVTLSNCTVSVPIDSEINYRSVYGWNQFVNVKESFYITIATNFTFVRKIVLAIKKLLIKSIH